MSNSQVPVFVAVDALLVALSPVTSATVPPVVETATVPSVVETATVPSVVETATVSSVVETATVPSVVETATVPSVVETATVPSVVVSAVVHSDSLVKKSQIAEIISVGSVPGYWAVQLRYLNDGSEAQVRSIYIGANPGVDDYALWQSKRHYVEARFEDYSGIVLVPCPEVVSV